MDESRVGFCPYEPYTERRTDLLIPEKTTGWGNTRLVWSTYEGTESQQSFELRMRFRGYPKGYRACTNWSNVHVITLNAEDCHPHFVDGMWYWDYDLAYIKDELVGNWSYDDRRFDMIYLEITVIANHTQDYKDRTGVETSRFAGTAATIQYRPYYQITAVYYSKSDEVTIEYETTWERPDDRFSIGDIYFRGMSYKLFAHDERDPLVSYWGTINGIGKIKFPTRILYIPLKGKDIVLHVAMNASYRTSGDSWDVIYRGIVEDRTICNTPIIVPQIVDGVVHVHTKDSMDLNAPIEQITVKLENGKYGVDEVTVAPGEDAIFPYCPFNTQLVFSAIGSRGEATSRLVYAQCEGIVGDCVMVDSIGGDRKVRFRMRLVDDDYGPQITTQGDFETVELARRRPSAFYGVGGKTHISYTASCPEAYAVVDYAKDYDQKLMELEEMPELGDVMLRFTDGRRYAIAAQLEIKHPSKYYRVVTISGDEVSA